MTTVAHDDGRPNRVMATSILFRRPVPTYPNAWNLKMEHFFQWFRSSVGQQAVFPDEELSHLAAAIVG